MKTTPIVANSKRRHLWLVVLVSLFVTVGGEHASAVDEKGKKEPSRQEPVSAELLDSRRKAVEQSKDLDEASRTKALENYRQAAEALKRADESTAKGLELKAIIDKAPLSAEAIKDELKRAKESSTSSKSPVAATPADVPLANVEAELTKLRAAVESLRKERSAVESETNRRANRRKELHSQKSSVSNRVADLKKQLSASIPKDEKPAVTLSRQTLLVARLQLAEQEPHLIDAELARYDAEDAVDLVRLQRDVLAQRFTIEEKRFKQLSEHVAQRRRREAEEAVAEARRKQVDAHPLLHSFAEMNTKLAEEARSLTRPMESVDLELKQSKKVLEGLSKQSDQTKEKSTAVGLTGPIGLLLRKQRGALPEARDYQRSLNERNQTIDEVQFRLFELDEQRSSVANPDPVVQSILESAAADSREEQREDLEKATREILDGQRQNLDVLTRSYNSYFNALIDLVITQRKLIEETDKCAAFIDERVLWIRSSRPLSFSEIVADERPISWFVGPERWLSLGRELSRDAQENPIPYVFAIVLLGGLIYFRSRLRDELKAMGREAQHAGFAHFLPTVRALAITVCSAGLAPAMIFYLGWRLGPSEQTTGFSAAVAAGLNSVALLLLPLEIIRESCRPHGLAEAHFSWSAGAIRTLRRNLRWLIWIGVPVTFVAQVLHASDPDSSHNALERFVFVAGMMIVAGFVYRVFHPVSGVLRELIPYEKGGWVDRLQFLWRWIGVAAALGVAGIIVAGYDYAAREFVWRMYLTGWMFFGVYYVRALFLRSLLIHRRRVGMQQARERRSQGTPQATAIDAALAAGAIRTEAIPWLDLATLSAQARQLANACLITTVLVGAWWIWLEVIPSLAILNQWELWQTTVAVSDPSNGALTEKLEPVTGVDVLAALMIGGLTWVAVQNIPGLLEMTLLQRLPLDNAGRFAATTVARYGIVMIGLLLASNLLGIGWAKVQWLATALTFGLAFGLQEIFANFIAGLIILFERPVRVGDIVTIDNVTGVVSRIRIRATTITNWDRKEFIVPNKEFITGRLLNWTLSDTVNRVVINVEIAYGASTDLARELMLKAAMNHPAVLKDPPPAAAFEEFGENGLKLVLRCFLPNLSERTRVIHELHSTINRSFADNSVEMAWPNKIGAPPAPGVLPSALTPPLFASNASFPKEQPRGEKDQQAA